MFLGLSTVVAALVMLFVVPMGSPGLTGEGGYVCVSQELTNGGAAFSFAYDDMGRLASVHRGYEGYVETTELVCLSDSSVQERQEYRAADDAYVRRTTFADDFDVVDGRVQAVRYAYEQTLSIGSGDVSEEISSADTGVATVAYHDSGAVASVTTQYSQDGAPVIRYYDEHGYATGSDMADDDSFRFEYDEAGVPQAVTIDSSRGWTQTFRIATDEHANITAMIDEGGQTVATFEWQYVPNLCAVGRYQALAYQPHFIVEANW